MAASNPVDTFAVLPDPGEAGSFDELVERLRLLKVWVGNPSFDLITDRVNAGWTAAGRPDSELARRGTVADCFKTGRRRVNADLVIAVVEALHPDAGYVAQWRQALRVVAGETRAAAQVRTQDTLPDDLAEFTGRGAVLDRLRHVLQRGSANDGGAVVISAIEGMAGVGKTRLAIHAGHVLHADEPFERVLFVNLRGFHPDPGQPPADPSAVLDGFLRLLGVPGQQVPHDLPARTALYRQRLAGKRALVVLDNAADEDQVRPLLPGPDCWTLVTSRRSLAGLPSTAHVSVDVFTEDEALEFLKRAVPDAPIGDDPDALARVTHRCGYLPLALGLVAGHMRAKTGWTVSDHADWLDERHHQQRLDTGVELALDLSYRHLPDERRRLLRLAALHPGHELDTYAVAALTDTDLTTVQNHLHQLRRDHLLQHSGPGRFVFHDLVRTYATSRATDEDRPAERRAALTRLFDHYLSTTATAMDTLHPAETHRRPRIPAPATPTPTFTDPDTALAWLDTERPTLVAVAVYTAMHGWPTYTTRLATTLYRYLDGGYHTDALTIHSNARHAAHHTDDPTAQATALTNLGATHMLLSRYGPAAEHFQQALGLFRQAGDPAGQARAVTNLGNIEERLGRYRQAADHYQQALTLYRQTADRVGEARALGNLGNVEERLGGYRQAADHHEQALTLYRQAGDRSGDAWTLNNLGYAEAQLGRYVPAAEHLQQALILFRQAGDRTGEAATLDSLGTLHTLRGQPAEATEHHQQALAMFRETGNRNHEAWVLNGLGEAAHTAGHPTDALAHHTAALTIATDIGNRDQQARANTGLGHAHHTLGNHAQARHHYQHALTLYTDLGVPEADEIRARLTTLDDNRSDRP